MFTFHENKYFALNIYITSTNWLNIKQQYDINQQKSLFFLSPSIDWLGLIQVIAEANFTQIVLLLVSFPDNKLQFSGKRITYCRWITKPKLGNET